MNIEVKISKRPIPYITAINYLEKRVDNIKLGKGQDFLWILEHPTIFTAGIRSNENDIIDKNIKIISTKRGGKITLHNPGQKIIYFALNLNNKKRDIRNLINIVENSIIEFLELYNIKSRRDKKNIGIWVKDKKIAAIGIRVSSWIAYHGFSINIKNNLSFYEKIVPCGLNNKKITSVERQTKKRVSEIEVKLKKIFLENLENI